jgi:hypothetical protein
MINQCSYKINNVTALKLTGVCAQQITDHLVARDTIRYNSLFLGIDT